MSLLIHADPGARSGFIAAWLTNKLTALSFDTGKSLAPIFYKIHKLENTNILKNYPGTKIRIRPNLDFIDLHTLLFLRKNVHDQIPDFTKNEYCLETFTKLSRFTQEIFECDSKLDHSLYDIVFDFSKTFDEKFLIDLYKKVNNKEPTTNMINLATQTNNVNKITIDKNHACSILKLCLTREKKLGLDEKLRHWSIVDIYRQTPIEQLYDAVLKSIVPENYATVR